MRICNGFETKRCGAPAIYGSPLCLDCQKAEDKMLDRLTPAQEVAYMRSTHEHAARYAVAA